MSYFTICKDSGKLATDACRKDIRITSAGYSPTQSAMAYWEDVDLGYCDQHVLVDYCKTGNGVATDYCKKFAEVDKTVEIEEVALVKLTKSQLDDIIKAGTVGLEKAFLRDDYIYYINDDCTPRRPGRPTKRLIPPNPAIRLPPRCPFPATPAS